MKKVFEDIIASNDIQAIKNCVTIMADCCEVGMNDSVMLDMMKQIKGEIGACHYNEDMADMHLCLMVSFTPKTLPKIIGMRSRMTTSISKTGAFSGEKW